MRIFQYISILVFSFLLVFAIYKNSPHYQIIKGEIYGTYYNIKINTNNKNKELNSKIKEKLQQIDLQMSVFNSSSEISHINNSKANIDIKLSSELSEVLKASYIVWKQTDGWFDPTLGGLINLWGFGNVKTSYPSRNNVIAVLKYTGFNKLKFKNNYQQIKKQHSASTINLSAIAKGYAVDKIAQLLDEHQYQNYIIDIGGEIKAKGFRSENEDFWNVAINKPREKSHENIMLLNLSNIAVATSGNYRNFYEHKGKKYSHNISSKTGYHVETDILSVSVFHDSCMYADAYATAINAMGVEKGLEFAEKYNIKAIIFDNKMQTIYTKSARNMME